jgi:hypothetical protein
MSLDQNLDDVLRWRFSRRAALKAGAGAVLSSQALLLQDLAFMPQRPALAATSFSDIQFDIGRFLTQGPSNFNDGAGNVLAQFGPIFTLLAPARLTRNPVKADQTTLANALNTIEGTYTAAPSGVLIAAVGYGLPYFNRLPQALVQSRMPRLALNTGRFVLEEVPPGGFPTDVSPANPGITKDRFNNTVQIETNDVFFELRSDSTFILNDVLSWLEGSNSLQGKQIPSPAFNGLLQFQTPRLMFVQMGMPRRVADQVAQSNPQLYEFHTRINPDSPMNMGFMDQQSNASAAAGDVIFASTGAGRGLTTARTGDYFDNGAVAHLSHDIEDLYQFYSTPNQDSRHATGEPFTERIMYMMQANLLGTAHGLASEGNADQFTNGGGPAFVNNVFQGNDAVVHEATDSRGQFTPGNATLDATFTGLPRIGHIAGLHRHGRTASGQPLHIRNDGPGFDSMDVGAFQLFPGGAQIGAGTNQFKLQFLAFLPTAETFRAMRVGVAAQDLAQPTGKTDPDDNGLERFITATRRQNFLVPPRRHRAFPLLELT